VRRAWKHVIWFAGREVEALATRSDTERELALWHSAVKGNLCQIEALFDKLESLCINFGGAHGACGHFWFLVMELRK
jgi:hypothetical protein